MSRCPKDAMGRNECVQTIRDGLNESAHLIDHPDLDLIVSTAPPPVVTPYTATIRCPHGVRYYIEPTAEQHRWWAEVKMP